MPLNDEELVHLKQLIVDPLSDKIDMTLKPLVGRVENLEGRMNRTEQTLGKVTKVYAVVVTAVTFVSKWIYGKVRNWL